jgi:hypothetical protein
MGDPRRRSARSLKLDSIDPVTRAAMQMGNCDNYESVTVKPVYHTIRESPQATTPNARFNFRIRLRKSEWAPNGPVQLIQ